MDLLTEYKNKQAQVLKEIDGGLQNLTVLPILQELSYRIMVLENLRILTKMAPLTLDQQALGYHFGLLKMNIKAFLTDRKIGFVVDETEKAKRATAGEALVKAIDEAFKYFQPPTTETGYKDGVSKIINVVLPIWMQYRDAYINFKEVLQ